MGGPEVSNRATNFLLAGVGGQGTLLAADVVARVGMQIGRDVKKSEVHGMAQRGGSVISHVRWSDKVYSPLIVPGEVDILVAFERLEALRYARMLRPGGAMLINDYRIAPVSVSTGADHYPSEEDELKTYEAVSRHYYVPAMEIASDLGNPRVNNIVLLGALAPLLEVPSETWLDVISSRVPERFVEVNRQGFLRGFEYTLAELSHGGSDAS